MSSFPAGVTGVRFALGALAVAVMLAVIELPGWALPEPWTLLICTALSVLVDGLYLTQSRGPARSVITPGFAVNVAVLWLTGLPGALICAVTGAVANAALRRVRRIDRIMVNTAAVALAVLAAGGVGRTLGLYDGHPFNLSLIVPTLAVLSVYFLVNSAVVALVLGLETGTSVVDVWRQHFLWLAPQYLTMGLVGAVGAAAYVVMDWTGLLGYAVALLAVYYSLRLYLRQVDRELRATVELNQRLESTNDQLIEMLASVVDARDSLLYGHSAQVATYAVAIGQEMGLAGPDLERIRKAALLHDVGKVAVPEQILFKPGPLTPDEYALIQHHAMVGERLVALADALQPLSLIVGQHHEAWNGKGYPRGFQGEEIELGARIVGLCDALDTILSDRPYKEGRPLDWAVAELLRCSGSQFDPAVVAAFLRVLAKEGAGFFCNSAYATMVGPQRTELFMQLRELGLNVRGQAAASTM